jgi:hypothetical protein
MVEENRDSADVVRPDGQSSQAPSHPSVRYEESDASLHWVLAVTGAAIVMGAIIFYVVFRLFVGYDEREAAVKASEYPLAAESSGRLPPEPRLEQIDRLAGAESGNSPAKSNEAVLRSYGPTSREGYVHIPIDRALELLDNKLPVREQQPSDEQAKRQNGLVDGGEPNSGRMFRGKTK